VLHPEEKRNEFIANMEASQLEARRSLSGRRLDSFTSFPSVSSGRGSEGRISSLQKERYEVQSRGGRNCFEQKFAEKHVRRRSLFEEKLADCDIESKESLEYASSLTSRRTIRSPSSPKLSLLRSSRLKNVQSKIRDPCDRCDSKSHDTKTCPWFKKARDDHPDANRRRPGDLGAGDGKVVFVKGAVVKQMPGDGNCLFHSLTFGLKRGFNAHTLRKEIARFISTNSDLEIAETPLKDWIKWDCNQSVTQYARRMAVTGWGGGIECAACSRLFRVNVHVWERIRKAKSSSMCFKRISCFDFGKTGSSSAPTINVLYCGGVHYNALELP